VKRRKKGDARKAPAVRIASAKPGSRLRVLTTRIEPELLIRLQTYRVQADVKLYKAIAAALARGLDRLEADLPVYRENTTTKGTGT
jgi:hypothetical protein